MTRLAMLAAALLVAVSLAAPLWAQTAAPTPPAAEIDAAKREAAAALVETAQLQTLATSTLLAMRSNLIGALLRSNPRLGPDRAAAVVDEVLMPDFRAQLGELVTAITMLYAAEFTTEELRALREFYASPLGQRVLRATPQLVVAGNRLGEAWARRVAEEALTRHAEELRRRGITL
jgi:hypothetical protein